MAKIISSPEAVRSWRYQGAQLLTIVAVYLGVGALLMYAPLSLGFQIACIVGYLAMLTLARYLTGTLGFSLRFRSGGRT